MSIRVSIIVESSEPEAQAPGVLWIGFDVTDASAAELFVRDGKTLVACARRSDGRRVHLDAPYHHDVIQP